MRSKVKYCRHYQTPIHHATCKAGINYRVIGDDSKPGYIARLPCVIGSPLTKDQTSCDKNTQFTDEEIAAQKEKQQEIFKLYKVEEFFK